MSRVGDKIKLLDARTTGRTSKRDYEVPVGAFGEIMLIENGVAFVLFDSYVRNRLWPIPATDTEVLSK